jgi:hypothetical protein
MQNLGFQSVVVTLLTEGTVILGFLDWMGAFIIKP